MPIELPSVHYGEGLSKPSDNSPFVALLQGVLGADIDGQFGDNTLRKLRSFQVAKNLPGNNFISSTDFEMLVGEYQLSKVVGNSSNTLTMADVLVSVAKGFLGQREKEGNTGWFDSEFEKQMRGVGWRFRDAWCCWFMKLIVTNAYSDSLLAVTFLNRVWGGHCLTTFNALRKSNRVAIDKTPSKGGIIFFRHGLTTGHVGISEAYSNGADTFTMISGNTADGGSREGITVARDKVRVDDKKIIGVVHLPESF